MPALPRRVRGSRAPSGPGAGGGGRGTIAGLRKAAAVMGIAAGFLFAAPVAGASAGSPYVVVFKASVGDVPGAVGALHGQLGVTATFQYASAIKGFATNLNDGQLNALRHNPNVAFVEPDVTFSAAGMVALARGETDPAGIRRIGAATTTSVHAASGVNVAELDSGIDLSNADLNAASGVNCVNPKASAQDDNGHGTNVAGVIAARDQGSGVVGVAPGTKLYAVKVLDKSGNGTLSQILCGINWVTANASALNIEVANMSLTGQGHSDGNCGHTNNDAEHQAICNSVSAGVSYVTA